MYEYARIILSSGAIMTDFEWPWQHSFPPFYTLQPNLGTRQKQLDAWCELVLAFHRHHNVHLLDLTEAASTPLFHNKTLNRKLSLEFIQTVMEELKKKGSLEWMDKEKKQCLVLWRSLPEWANLIYSWACESGQVNSVCTLYEIIQGDYTANQEFHGLEKEVLLRALRHLEEQGKAQLMLFDASEGVKFLAT